MSRRTSLALLIFSLMSMLYAVADSRRLVFHRQGQTDSVPIDAIDSMTVAEDSLYLFFSCGHRDTIPMSLDSVTFASFARDTLYILWSADGATVYNPFMSQGVSVHTDGGHIAVCNRSNRNIDIRLGGSTDDGSLRVCGTASAHILAHNLYLANQSGGAISVESDSLTLITLHGTSTLVDGQQRDSLAATTQRGCLTTSGDLVLQGGGQLNVTGNYKHAVYAGKKLSVDGCTVSVVAAASDGLRAKKKVSITNASITASHTVRHAVNSDNSSVSIAGSTMRLSLYDTDSKGIAAAKDIVCRHSTLDLQLHGKAAKGMKSKGSIVLANSAVTAHATGGVMIEGEDKTYCSIAKCDSCLTVDSCTVDVRHDGVGGKGFCCDSVMTLRDSHVEMLLTGFGAPYLVNHATELDYFTPRCMESKRDMNILSGTYTMRATGTGGKGIVCDSTLTIGTCGMDDSLLVMNITTEGTVVIDDVVADRRYGCPKAIKCGERMVMNGGTVMSRTMGMGGEGVESKGYLTINGGTLVCEAFDDGINVERGITINGGRIYATSIDNDGIDSNGFIALNGGVVASLTSHESDEDFDCDDDTFYLSGGTICGVGRSCSGISRVGQPYYQHIAYVRDKVNLHTDTIAAYTIPAGCYVTYADSADRPVMTVLVHDTIPAAFATVSCAAMRDGAAVKIYQTAEPPAGAQPLIDGKVWIGGEPIDTPPLVTGMATLKPFMQPGTAN